EAETRRLLLERPGELSGLLRHPFPGRVGSAASEMDAAAARLDEEENVAAPQRDRLDSEEINGEPAGRLRADDRSPRGRDGCPPARPLPRRGSSGRWSERP